MSKSINERFNENREMLLEQTENYLKNPRQNNIDYRSELKNLIIKGDFSKALQNLEMLRDQKTGINTIEMDNPRDPATPILIRDARTCANPGVRSTESFEIQYLNTIRAAMDLVSTIGVEGDNDPSKLKLELQNKALAFIDNFHDANKDKSQKELIKITQKEIAGITKLMGDNGMPDVHKKLEVMRECQNLNDKHGAIVTISSVGGKTVFEGEVPLKGLTEEQKSYYSGLKNQSWFKSMNYWEQKLCTKYAPIITEGNHVISTQLRKIPGLRNAFEKITGIAENNKIEVLHTSKHAGATACLSDDKNMRQTLSDANARQAKEWVDKDKVLHCNTFNSANIGVAGDIEFADRNRDSMKTIGGKNTNTAFNILKVAGAANRYTGVKDTLNAIADKCPDPELASHLRPRGRFERVFGFDQPKGDLDQMLKNVSEERRSIYIQAIDLRRDLDKADVPLRLGDRENISLTLSTKLNFLTQSLSKVESFGIKEDMLNMCASGKDRTGLAEHDQSAQIISKKLGITIKEVDQKLLASGHTAQQAGGIYAGGCTVGCYGTKYGTSQGIPKSRNNELQAIIEDSSELNKINPKWEKSLPVEKTLDTQKISSNLISNKSVNIEKKLEPFPPELIKSAQNIGNKLTSQEGNKKNPSAPHNKPRESQREL